MNEIKRPKQKVKRQIKRSNIALDDYMFDRKMQSLYYSAKPKSDDLPRFLKVIRLAYRRSRKELRVLPKTISHAFRTIRASARKYPARYLTAGLVGLVVVFFGGTALTKHKNRTPASQPVGGSTSTQGIKSRIPLDQTPAFSTLLPQGKTAKDVGGFAKVSPDGSPAAYTYKDKIGEVDILVTQQELPASMKVEPSKEVEKLAVGFNATQSVKTEKSEFFIGTNSGGAQSVITYNKSLLIFLKSDNKIPNERWQTYIEDLK